MRKTEMLVDISDKYLASSDGHIINKKTGRQLKEFLGKDGYFRTQFDGKTRTVHRVIAKAFVKQPVGKDFVNHIDGNKSNNSVDNLEWCTRSENMKHAYGHGLKSSKGMKNGRSILSEEDIKYIRSNYIPRDNNFGSKVLASKFGVAHQTISAVIRRQNWKEE